MRADARPKWQVTILTLWFFDEARADHEADNSTGPLAIQSIRWVLPVQADSFPADIVQRDVRRASLGSLAWGDLENSFHRPVRPLKICRALFPGNDQSGWSRQGPVTHRSQGDFSLRRKIRDA